MKLIGLTGGIGSGKSTVAQLLRERGWKVYSSDETARMIMDTDSEVQQQIMMVLRGGVVDNGVLSREKIAELVFSDSKESADKLEALERIIHPKVIEQHMLLIEAAEQDGVEILAIESALLYEVGLDDGFDWVIVVDSPEEVCIERVMKRSNVTREQVLSRMQAQLPTKEKRQWADFVIDNDGSLESLHHAVNTVAHIIELLPEQQ